jgi:hypothetical protein
MFLKIKFLKAYWLLGRATLRVCMFVLFSNAFIQDLNIKSYDAVWGLRLKAEPKQPKICFPFSKPSPFSSMTEWLLG